jgi:hypothetical protein
MLDTLNAVAVIVLAVLVAALVIRGRDGETFVRRLDRW